MRYVILIPEARNSKTGADSGEGGGGAPGKNMIFFGVKWWFFTWNTPKIFAPPSARRNFFKCAPPLTCNPGSAPVKLPYILLLWMQEKLLTSFGTTVCLETRNMKPARPWMLAHLKIIWQFHAHPVNPKDFLGRDILGTTFFRAESSLIQSSLVLQS
jgi:hypothetical protein